MKKDGAMINQLDENGERHGLREECYSDGSFHYKGAYKSGKEHGLWEVYYPDGHTLYRGEYKNSNEIGLWYERRREH